MSDDKKTPQQKVEKRIRISSSHPAGGHWRAGVRWSRETRDVPVSDFTNDQLAALKADRHLVVVEL